MRLVTILGLMLFACGLYENFRHQRNLRKIPIRILVNGTRGKSSVTRLIAGALRESGRRTIAKTTGSDARVILEDGTEIPVRRPFGPRITEQKDLARLAARRRAEILVVECMAVRPESQMVLQRQLVRATICVITNVRVDHVEEIGRSLEDTAAALSLSVPRRGTLITADKRVAGAARRVLFAEPSPADIEALSWFPYPEFAENVALALRAAEELGVDRETALRGMVKAKPDVGVLRLLKVDLPESHAIFIDAFAANDVRSTRMVWEEASRKVPSELPLVLLYNNRADREYRIREFLDLPRTLGAVRAIATIGDRPEKVARFFSRTGAETLAFARDTPCAELLASLAVKAGGSFLLFGVGNFHGSARDIVSYCVEHGSAFAGC